MAACALDSSINVSSYRCQRCPTGARCSDGDNDLNPAALTTAWPAFSWLHRQLGPESLAYPKSAALEALGGARTMMKEISMAVL